MNATEIEVFKALFKSKTTQLKVFELLSDQNWHCRMCEGATIGSGQYAGGGGIQGLERGTQKRPGLVLIKKTDDCPTCGKKTTWDCWTGETQSANAASPIPKKLQTRILEIYGYCDVIENRQRQKHELVIDHRFPMERWGKSELPNTTEMSDTEIQQKFQLLKKDSSGNHNLLKSRSCERCIKTGKRGIPLGIQFWYEGDENWPTDIPEIGPEAEKGCVGCGWYDFARWRTALNKTLQNLDNG